MSTNTIVIMPLVIPNYKPRNYYYLSSLNRKHYYSKLRSCFVNSSSTNQLRRHYFSLQCSAAYDDDGVIVPSIRRSGNYDPPFWDFNYIQSLTTEYTDDKYLKTLSELIVKVKMLLEDEALLIDQKLELIDDLQRLGISYHFHHKIDQILNSLYHHHQYQQQQKYYQRDLYSTALQFRLLRQQGYRVCQEVFDCFKNDKGDNFEQGLGDDTKGLLQLYEASFLQTQGEETLELARQFSSNLLHKIVDDHLIDDDDDDVVDDDDDIILLMVRHALELPLHWTTPRLNTRWLIKAYENKMIINPLVLQLAKLDFNIAQASYQQELKLVSRWWKQTSLAEKLPFARSRVVESYILNIGDAFLIQPDGYNNNNNLRIMGTKVNSLVTIIDDMFDVHATLEELHLFNDSIQRWDVEAIEQLPEYMQICFLALNNFVNEMAYDVLKQQGVLIIPHLRKLWMDLCASYLKEAIWYSQGYKPTLEEYMSNAWISISVPLMISHAYFIVANPIDEEVVQSLYDPYHDILRCSGTIVRLANDLGTSQDEMERGDVPKSIQCYMNESGVDREEARQYVMLMIRETWKKMNEETNLDSPLPQHYYVSKIAVDFCRIAHYMYNNGDGYGTHHQPGAENRVSSLLFEPIL